MGPHAGAAGRAGPGLTQEEIIRNLQIVVNGLTAEIIKKDEAISLGNSTNQALEAAQVLEAQKNQQLGQLRGSDEGPHLGAAA